MKQRLFQLFFCSAFAVLFVFSTSNAREVTGSAILKLSKPASKETVDQLRQKALKYFRVDLWEWMREEADISVDTTNAIQLYHFNTFTDSCVKKAKVVSGLEDHSFKSSITLPGEDARTILEAYNTRCFTISLRYYTLMKKAVEDSAVTDLFSLGIQTIFYTMGRMGTPIGMPDESTPRSFLLQDARKTMQNFFSKFTVRSDEFIIAGKPGTLLANPVKVQIFINKQPLVNVNLVGVLPGGKKICSQASGTDGTVLFENFKIPYVAKGTMLYFKPDVSAPVPGATPFEAIDLGLTLPEQTLLFNTIPITYSLQYTATSANAMIVPKDFTSAAFVKKFLKDSCFMTPAPAGQQPDIYFTVVSQLSSYSNDETEQTTRKLENDITIQDATKKMIGQKQELVLEKVYENAVPIQEGLFYWEAASKSMKMLKSMIYGLTDYKN